MSKNRRNGNNKRRKRPPAVPGLLIAEKTKQFRYRVQYDCPWCGAEHTADLNENPPVILKPPCAKGSVNLHRVEQKNDEDS